MSAGYWPHSTPLRDFLSRSHLATPPAWLGGDRDQGAIDRDVVIITRRTTCPLSRWRPKQSEAHHTAFSGSPPVPRSGVPCWRCAALPIFHQTERKRQEQPSFRKVSEGCRASQPRASKSLMTSLRSRKGAVSNQRGAWEVLAFVQART